MNMSEYTFWKTVSIRVGLLVAIKRLGEKPTPLVDRLVRQYVMERSKELGIDIDDVVAELEPKVEVE
jgi:hypothetical protein